MSITWWFLLGTAIVWIIFDVWIISYQGKQASISATLIRKVNRDRLSFFIVLAIGIVLGHIFWSMPTENVYKDMECIKKVDNVGNL